MYKSFCLPLWISILLPLSCGCVASYHPIEPPSVQFDQLADTLPPLSAAVLPDSVTLVPDTTGRKAAADALAGSLLSPQPGRGKNVSFGMFTGLGGRQILKMARIEYESGKEGIVVLDICVDPDGRVSYARFSEKGSTTRDGHLVELALENIRKWVFSQSSEEKDCGTATYRFLSK